MSDFSYILPFSDEKLKTSALGILRKGNEEWASLLQGCKMTIEEHGTSYYYDHARNSRWDAIAVVIKFYVSQQKTDILESYPDHILRQIFSDLIPADVGYDVKAIKYIPDLSEALPIEVIESTLDSIVGTPFAQAIEHYQQAKRQMADAADERRRKDSVRDCASAMESIIKILGKDDDIKKASANLRAAKKWGLDDIVKDGDAIFNKLHYLYPDLRHGAQQTSRMSLSEAQYWLDRISAYISYMMRENENITWPF